MQFWEQTIWAESTESVTGNITKTATVDIPSSNVLITCALQHVSQLGSNGLAQIAITSYVQNGNPQTGFWQILNRNNITSVTFSLSVTNARAGATGLIIAINE